MAKKRNQGQKSEGKKRSEERFATSTTYMPKGAAVIGMLGCLVLGVGVFALWILDPPTDWAAYAVAAGGLGLGAAMWFGQAKENAILVGDAGIAVENDRETLRVQWYNLKRITITGDAVVLESSGQRLDFCFGANKSAIVRVLEQTALRAPDVIDVDKTVTEALPKPNEVTGKRIDVDTDQVTGRKCRASETPIHLEEEARFCPRCGALYHVQHAPSSCLECTETLSGRLLRA